MDHLKLPASCAFLSDEEQRTVSGGGPFMDALDTFLTNLHLDNFLWGNSFITLSFTFVPALLFNVVKTGVSIVVDVTTRIAGFLGTTTDALVRSVLEAGTPSEPSSDPVTSR